MTVSHSESIACHVCGRPGLVLIPGFERLARTTSDCKVWPAGGQMAVCPQCGCAQTVLDAAWHRDADAIYGDYQIYHQSAGAEQSVFDAVSGRPLTRSAFLVERLRETVLRGHGTQDGAAGDDSSPQDDARLRVPHGPTGQRREGMAHLPEIGAATQHGPTVRGVGGRMMDFGCGIGNLLRSFGAVFPDWTLAGLELSDAQRARVESIERVERLFTPPLDQVPGEFDLITMVHALEHIAGPLGCLREVHGKLKAGGLVLVEVPDCAANPFMFLVADHASHFCLPVLQRLVENAGFEIVVATNQWIAKELTVIGRKIAASREPVWSTEGGMDAAALAGSRAWLEKLSGEARRLSSRKPFGIFGTSIAATFLVGELGEAVDFFVDEDPGRQGQVFNGRPIYAPTQVPAGGHVFLGLAPVAAEKVSGRMNAMGLEAHFYGPPPLHRRTD